jgi:hypothetical protein
MTLTRSRLTAAALCALLVLAVVLLAIVLRGPDPARMAAHQPPLRVMAPPSLPSEPISLPKAQFIVDSPSASSGPQISPTAAPGVAFNYRYGFRLPPERIAGVQERHAQLCERLGAGRCRISGMLYRVLDSQNVEARLELRLDPALARHFGRTGAEMVSRAEGMLVESEISGVDAAGAIRIAGRDIGGLERELARIEAQLRPAGGTARLELDDRAQQLRDRLRALRDDREAQRESLATTPMLFQYGAGTLVPAAAATERPALKDALDRSIGNLLGGMGILLVILVTLLPWAAVGLAGWWLARLIRRRLFAPVLAPSA